MKAAFMRADSPAMRTSAASAIAKPPPHAAPCTAAMIGCGARRISMHDLADVALRRGGRRAPTAVRRRRSPRASFRSSPAQKARPAPRTTTTRVSRVVGEAPEEVAQLVHQRRDSAFSASGRSSVQPGEVALALDAQRLVHGSLLQSWLIVSSSRRPVSGSRRRTTAPASAVSEARLVIVAISAPPWVPRPTSARPDRPAERLHEGDPARRRAAVRGREELGREGADDHGAGRLAEDEGGEADGHRPAGPLVEEEGGGGKAAEKDGADDATADAVAEPSGDDVADDPDAAGDEDHGGVLARATSRGRSA